jgi:cytochrome c553
MHIVVIVWLVSSAFVAFLLNKLDGIVHGDLYDYGLQFSFAWAMPFWSFERFIYICLAVPAVLSAVALVVDIRTKGKDERPTVKHVDIKPGNAAKAQNGRENSMLINCPKCHKVFGKPLTMLDFTGGKTKLVNVCPYCNHVLSNVEEGDSVDVQAADQEEVIQQQ